MSKKNFTTIDGNEAASYIAFKTSEVIAVAPIAPSSAMGENADAWAAKNVPNIWGAVPSVVEMQSEGGAAGAVHGSLQAGALTTTFTASQGLLLMIPNMYKIAGELTSTVFHISARSLAMQALCIFGDHGDVMATRETGFAMLFGNSVQEAQDMAMVAHSATLKSRVPFLNIFDGFRTSHEVQKIEQLTDDEIRAMIDPELVKAHRERALSPDRPKMRGTAQNPDVYFQGRETANPYYEKVPGIVQATMDDFAKLTGRQYHLFDYYGAPDAERVIVIMGSGAETTEETVEALNAQGEKLGLLKVRLYRPFSVEHMLAALPKSVKAIAVLDRTKEPGCAGEPLYQDVITALGQGIIDGQLAAFPKVVGGRYGLGSKEFTPGMVKAVYDELAKPKPKHNFTVGIIDDVSGTSLKVDSSFSVEAPDVRRGIFYGLGADGTVGANKNTIKIIGGETESYAQGYFVYDSKKSGSVTISHLRFGPRPIKSIYLIQQANFVACHQFGLLLRYPVLDCAQPGATFLLNSPFGPDDVWNELPKNVQKQVIDKKLKFYVIDGYTVAKNTGMGARINTIMQTAYFALSGVLPKDEAIEKIRQAIKKTYGARGDAIVQKNFAAVDQSLEHLFEVKVPSAVTSTIEMRPPVPPQAPEFVQKVTAEMIAGRGDSIPTSLLPADGTYPTGTAQWEKREVSLEAPVWEPDVCIQCGKCALVCPHGVVRGKVISAEDLAKAPEGFRSAKPKFKTPGDEVFTMGVSVKDCTGCGLCMEVCPAKDKSNVSRRGLTMKPILEMTEGELAAWDYFVSLPDVPKTSEPLNYNNVKNLMLKRPLFEFSGACAGCGETPYVKLMTQLFGDRAIIANATGCSSIYGGNLPTTPYAINQEGRGPAWNNSLFEDNAEFGMGMRMAINAQRGYAEKLLGDLNVPAELKQGLLAKSCAETGGYEGKRELVAKLRELLGKDGSPTAEALEDLADVFVERSVWILGGDGWAYDIGYGGLDHVLASGANVNVLVLDTEVYSNTGGQASKSTARGAVAKFAAGGKASPKKDLGRMAMAYGNVYVATVSIGANDAHAIKAFTEAEAFEGPSLIIAYAHCIAHGIDMRKGLSQQKTAVEAGYWPLYRYNPALAEAGKNPFSLDSRRPTVALEDYVYSEARYKMLQRSNPQAAAELLELAKKDVADRWAIYERLASTPGG